MSSGNGGWVMPVDRRVRYAIYQHFARRARGPNTADIASELGVPKGEVEASVRRLADAQLIVLAPGSLNIWMAHPFSAVPTAYPVITKVRRYWANCAWDALAIPGLLGVDSEIRTQCPDCGEPIMLRVADGSVEESEAVVHFLVPPRRFWENVGFT